MGAALDPLLCDTGQVPLISFKILNSFPGFGDTACPRLCVRTSVVIDPTACGLGSGVIPEVFS